MTSRYSLRRWLLLRSREQSEKVKLLEARVETLEQDNSALKDKASKLQEKVKAAAKEKRGILFLL